MEFIKQLIQEGYGRSGSDNYDLYHSSYSEAVQEALNMVRTKGFEVDEDEIFRVISTGPRKPPVGDTVSLKLPLLKDGRETARMLHFQVYNRGESKAPFELNAYIS